MEIKFASHKVWSFKVAVQDFPGSPVVKTPHMECRGHGFDPWSLKILHAACCSQKRNKMYSSVGF